MKSVAIDLDGTLRSWESGNPIEGAARAMRQLTAQGVELILHTCRTQMPGGHDEVGRFLSQPAFSKVNFVLWEAAGKPVASAYVDDRSVEFRGNWTLAQREIEWLLKHRPELGNDDRPRT